MRSIKTRRRNVIPHTHNRPRSFRSSLKSGLLAAVLGLSPTSNLLAGAVVTDGTLAPASTLAGPNFNVTSALGRQVGPNLFHSLSTFNLAKGDTATFSGPTSVSNVITRVTGGTASSINGKIQCTIPAANFFLINPSGMVFGPDAAIDVKGSFVVTTADYLKLADGNKFSATSISDTTLTSAAPSAFGFLAAKPAAIAVNGSTMAVSSGATLSLVGGDVQIVNGTIQAPGGRVNLVATASAGELTFDATSLLASIDLTPGAQTLGDVLLNTSSIGVSGSGGGRVSVRAATLEMNGSAIFASPSDVLDGLGVDILLTGNATLAPGLIVTDSSGAGRAGPVSITAAGITIDGTGQPPFTTGISAAAASSGAGGDIHLQTGSLKIMAGSVVFAGSLGGGAGGNINVDATGGVQLDGGSILATASATGGAGNVTLAAGSLQLTHDGTISASTSSMGNAGRITIDAGSVSVDNTGSSNINVGILAGSFAGSAGGKAGDIVIRTGSLSLTEGGIISASTFGFGAAGSVSITGGSVVLDEGASSNFTGLFALSFSSGAGGAAGTVSVNASSLQILGGAVISADSQGNGAAGSIDVTAANLLIDGRGLGLLQTPLSATGLLTNSNNSDSAASGGRITVQTANLSLIDGGLISADSLRGGNAGNVTVNATQSISLDGKGHLLFTGIFADSLGATGDAGNIAVTTPNLSIIAGGSISAGAFGAGGRGSITIAASNSFLLDGQSLPIPTSIITEADGGPSGAIQITGGDLSIVGGAEISSSSFGAGSAGTIAINARSVNVQGAIIASRTFSSGDAGTLNVTADLITVGTGGSLTTGTSGAGKAGTVNIAAQSLTLNGGAGTATIDSVTSATGDAGAVNIQAASLQLQSGGAITAFTLDQGKGGQVGINAGTLTIDGMGSTRSTGILASAVGTGDAGNIVINADAVVLRNRGQIKSDANAAGKAGDVAVNSGLVAIFSESVISSGTFGSGASGDVVVNANQIHIDAKNAILFTGITAQTQAQGKAGSVTLTATESLRLINGGEISSTTFGAGDGGSVHIRAQNLLLRNKGFIDSASSTAAPAGVIDINVNDTVTLNHSRITTEATLSRGGGITLEAGGNINLLSSQITTQALGEGGAIFIKSPAVIDIRNSQIITQAGDNGGSMTVDPSFVLLESSRLSANGGNNGGNIAVRPDFLLQSNSLITATGARGVSGTLQITPNYNLTGALLSLPANLSDSLTLQPSCAANLPGAVSSFIVTGRGGEPLRPGGFTPALELRMPVGRENR